MPTPTYALDLDQPAVQGVVLQFLVTVAETLRRAADAIEAGNEARERAIEELGTAQVLLHYLRRRLGETLPTPAEPGQAPEGD